MKLRILSLALAGACMTTIAVGAAARHVATTIAAQDRDDRLETIKKGGALGIFSLDDADRAVAFRNLDKIADFAVVHKGAKVRPLPLAAKQIDVHFDDHGQSFDTAAFMRANHASGVLVLDHGKIALERYGLGRTSSDLWTSFSVTKSVSSTLIGAAIKDGKIKSLDDKVSTYITELKGSVYDQVTVRNLITMTSGTNWNEDFSDPNNDIAKLLQTSFVDNMKGRHLDSPPGTKFHYNTGDASLQTIIVERAVGMPAERYLQQKIWQPYGMEHDAHWFAHRGEVMGGANLQMTLRDFGRFGQFFLEGGKAGATQALPETWTREATQRLFPTGWGDVSYGYSWWANADGSYRAIGIYGQAIYINPDRQIVIVINSAWSDPEWDEGYKREDAYFAAVLQALK